MNGCDFVVGVDGSVDLLFQKGLDLGGTDALALSDMQGVGRVGYLLDPDHNVLGLISPVLSDGTNVMAAKRRTATPPPPESPRDFGLDTTSAA